ncbi:MAG: tRNA dihydrouridine(20/20a) synthase DusA [Gammaproteobacteria bacterium]
MGVTRSRGAKAVDASNSFRLHTLCVAPMMQRTDRHQRYFLRLISKHALLYTEMITSSALVHGNPSRLLQHDPSEHPLALQIGGSDPREMKACATRAGDCGFLEVNINAGCPSTRVQAGGFGACLMTTPERVAECVAAMGSAVNIPITVKTRIGVDCWDSYDFLVHFIDTVAKGGCRTFIVHARKAWLRGLSPKENRHKPPLQYDIVKQLKRDFPSLEIVINGGIRRLDEARYHLSAVDGVMIGREVYRNPYLFATVDQQFYADHHPIPTRHQVVEAYLPYAAHQISRGVSLYWLSRPLFGLFQNQPGARSWRQVLSWSISSKNNTIEALSDALSHIPRTVGTALPDGAPS